MKEKYHSVAEDITDMSCDDEFWGLTRNDKGSSAACLKAILQSLDETRDIFNVKLDTYIDRDDPEK